MDLKQRVKNKRRQRKIQTQSGKRRQGPDIDIESFRKPGRMIKIETNPVYKYKREGEPDIEKTQMVKDRMLDNMI